MLTAAGYGAFKERRSQGTAFGGHRVSFVANEVYVSYWCGSDMDSASDDRRAAERDEMLALYRTVLESKGYQVTGDTMLRVIKGTGGSDGVQ